MPKKTPHAHHHIKLAIEYMCRRPPTRIIRQKNILPPTPITIALPIEKRLTIAKHALIFHQPPITAPKSPQRGPAFAVRSCLFQPVLPAAGQGLLRREPAVWLGVMQTGVGPVPKHETRVDLIGDAADALVLVALRGAWTGSLAALLASGLLGPRSGLWWSASACCYLAFCWRPWWRVFGRDE
ncbi:hypothetical protein BC567DRAFT_69148 [Phyllosticta citribraziliensis]